MEAQSNVVKRALRLGSMMVDPVLVDPVMDLEFDKAFAFLRTLVDIAEAERWHPSRDNAGYTTSVILWMLVFQRLHPDIPLEAAVKQLIETAGLITR